MTALLLQWRSLLLQARSPKTGHTITLVWPLCYWAVSIIASKVPDETTRKVAGETSPLIIVSTHTSLPSSFHLAPSIIISTHLLSSSPHTFYHRLLTPLTIVVSPGTFYHRLHTHTFHTHTFYHHLHTPSIIVSNTSIPTENQESIWVYRRYLTSQ